jgi:tetratricopeptide (TPR) repeat protein
MIRRRRDIQISNLAISVLWGLSTFGFPASAPAQQPDHKPHSHALGAVNFANSGNHAAQPAFQRGVALLHSFEYGDAIDAFKEAQKADPSLAMAYWLEAFSHSHIVWGEEDLSASRAVLNRLAATPEARLAKAKTDWERAFGSAIEAFYVDAALPVRARALADSLTSLAARLPDNHEAGAFASLASMIAWYTVPAERAKYYGPVQQNALRVFRANAQHPGAAHYLIHFVDMNPRAAADGLEFARAYDKIAPDAEHALHMPSHVFLPLGLWDEVATSNERAWAAARRDVLARKASPAGNSWHALDWLQYSYLQLGRHNDARALIDTAQTILRGVPIADDNPDARNVVNELAFAYAMNTGNWDSYPSGIPTVDAALKQPTPTPRAVGFARTAAYQAAVAALRAKGDAAPARNLVAVLRTSADSLPAAAPQRAGLQRMATQLEAMVAHKEGNTERAVTLLRELAPTEPNNASLPPKTIPSYELLGEYLLAAGRKAEAVEAYQKALDLRPNRALAKRGLENASKP